MSPTPDVYDWLDNLELSHGQLLMLFQVNPDRLDDPPRLRLQELDEPETDLDSGEGMWLYPEDVPKLIAWLEEWLQRFRECAKIDREKMPVPFWGDLDCHRKTPKTDPLGTV